MNLYTEDYFETPDDHDYESDVDPDQEYDPMQGQVWCEECGTSSENLKGWAGK